MALENAYTKWGSLAELHGWRIERSPGNGRMRWYPPDGGAIITTSGPAHNPPPSALANDRSRLIRAGLPIREEEGESMAKREETVRGMGPSPEETAAALDAFIELATEEIAALRRDYRALEENLERSVKAHAGVLRGLEADVRALKARPEVMPGNFVTKAALERTLLVQAEALTGRLDEAVKEAAAHQDPLGAFRAKMRGGL